jgi:sugar phosphate isomerase/epimerase
MENIGPRQTLWISFVDPERRHRESAMDEIKRSLELTDAMPVSYVVFHLGNPHDSFNPVVFDYAYAAVSRIREFAGVRVMVENIPNEISTIERIVEFKRVAEVPDIGICYDTGHAYLQGVTGSLEHIHTTHVHDNHRERDEHLWPFEGSLDWPALIEKLVLAKYAGPMIFEARGDISKGAEAQSRLRDLWDEALGSIEEFRLKYKLPSP